MTIYKAETDAAWRAMPHLKQRLFHPEWEIAARVQAVWDRL
jgi:hypothetical protein